ncbi:MAG TPA: hypothetical protein VFW94_23710 [Candidatus Acidoferrales bacterium]|nr:hypothetical protein [Candidatus Acidoferrales bacterium]
MGYRESENKNGVVKIEISCDARKGKGICGNQTTVIFPQRRMATHFLYELGWRVLRNHQVCGSCLKSGKRVVFPRKGI